MLVHVSLTSTNHIYSSFCLPVFFKLKLQHVNIKALLTCCCHVEQKHLPHECNVI